MNDVEKTVKYFNDKGRRIAEEGMRVFGNEPSHYYQLEQPKLDYQQIFDQCSQHNSLPADFTAVDFECKAKAILEYIKSSSDYSNLLKGVHLPFVFYRDTGESDLGTSLENRMLPNLQKSFNARYPEAHFKAVLQSDSQLIGNITLDKSSGYEKFIAASEKGPVVGWYFPQALQEFDVRSQREQMKSLPALEGGSVCLSGGMDICAALTGSPSLLISEEFYTPILCMSAYVHKDERLVLLLKAYGPHMEFWCMTQMLTPKMTQVSEQWAGGITIF